MKKILSAALTAAAVIGVAPAAHAERSGVNGAFAVTSQEAVEGSSEIFTKSGTETLFAIAHSALDWFNVLFIGATQLLGLR